MTDITKLIDDFSQLSLEDQKGKIVNLINQGNLVKLDTIFTTILDMTANSDRVNDEFLIGVYTEIMTFADKVHEYNQEQKMSSFIKLQKQVQHMHEAERQEREQENPDEELGEALNNLG